MVAEKCKQKCTTQNEVDFLLQMWTCMLHLEIELIMVTFSFEFISLSFIHHLAIEIFSLDMIRQVKSRPLSPSERLTFISHLRSYIISIQFSFHHRLLYVNCELS